MNTTSLQTVEGRSTESLSALPPTAETIIRPVSRRVRLRDITRNPSLVRILVSRDMKVKYKQSLLGPIWLVFQPAAMLVGFVVGFSSVAHIKTQGVPYAIFALTGLSVWSYFSAAASSGAISLVGNTNLVRFTACPRVVLTVSNLLASWPALVVPTMAAVVAALATGSLSIHLIAAPLVVVWLFLLTASFTAILASLAVRYRDVPAALPFILQAGVFFAPIAYPVSHLSGALRAILTINPITGLLSAWRWCLLGIPMDAVAVAVALALTATLAALGWRIFTRLEVTMTDDI
jgi:homopolymeric O-antigen transport system permease protein